MVGIPTTHSACWRFRTARQFDTGHEGRNHHIIGCAADAHMRKNSPAKGAE